MFKSLDIIKEKYGVKIKEDIMRNYYDDAVLFWHEMDFKYGVNVVVFSDYYLQSVEIRLKFATEVRCQIEELSELSRCLESLVQEIKNYFKNLREKT